MLNIENLTNFTINKKLLEKISKELLNGNSREIDIVICDNRTIKEYNREYRAKNSATDVLSFPMESDIITNLTDIPLGSIVISADFVLEKAKEFGHSNQDEFSLLFIHGVLHLLGFDHEIDSGEMREKEEETIKKFNLPQSLIIRVEEES